MDGQGEGSSTVAGSRASLISKNEHIGWAKDRNEQRKSQKNDRALSPGDHLRTICKRKRET